MLSPPAGQKGAMSEMSDKPVDEKLGDMERELRDYVAAHSPSPEVDLDNLDRQLTEAPPAEAAEELSNMVGGFHRGGGQASGRRSTPAEGEPPTAPLEED